MLLQNELSSLAGVSLYYDIKLKLSSLRLIWCFIIHDFIRHITNKIVLTGTTVMFCNNVYSSKFIKLYKTKWKQVTMGNFSYFKLLSVTIPPNLFFNSEHFSDNMTALLDDQIFWMRLTIFFPVSFIGEINRPTKEVINNSFIINLNNKAVSWICILWNLELIWYLLVFQTNKILIRSSWFKNVK